MSLAYRGLWQLSLICRGGCRGLALQTKIDAMAGEKHEDRPSESLKPLGEVAPKLLEDPAARHAFDREVRRDAALKPTTADRLANARVRRDEILATGRWLRAAEVAAHRRDDLATAPDEYTGQLRHEGRLFGVKYRGEYLYPDFQFDSSGQPSHALHRLLTELKPTLDEDPTGWTSAFWLFQRSRALDGEAPASAFPRDHERVIAHARLMFSIEGGW